MHQTTMAWEIRQRLLQHPERNGLMLLDTQSDSMEIEGVLVLQHGHRWQVLPGGDPAAYSRVCSEIRRRQDWYVVIGDQQMMQLMAFDTIELERTYLLRGEPRGQASFPVQALSVKDFPDIGNLVASVQEFGGSFRPAKLRAELEMGQPFLGVRLSGSLVGCLRIEEKEEIAGVFSLCVDPRFRGRGIATSLIVSASRMMRPRPLFLTTHNPAAERLYRFLGFQMGCDLFLGTKNPPAREPAGSESSLRKA